MISKVSKDRLPPLASSWDNHQMQRGEQRTNPPYRYRVIRRTAELFFCLVGGLLLLALIPWLWLANVVYAPGPLFYWQTRVGHYGRPFVMIKFRSMVVDAEPDGPVWASPHDPRITAVGQFLRRMHLDELPQLWHVLRGEMSLIGPRPERPLFVAALTAHDPLYATRHRIKPGLTGWAQIHCGYSATMADAFRKLSYDLAYIEQPSLWLDWLILHRTLRLLLGFAPRPGCQAEQTATVQSQQ